MQVICWRIGLLVGLMCIVFFTIPAAAEEEPETATTDAVEEPKAKTTDTALTVKEIEFEGIMEESEGLIKSIIQTRVGEEISPYQLSQDIKNLHKDTGFFEDIPIDVVPAEDGGLKVIYRLIPNPKIEGIINIIGNEELKYNKIKDAISLKPGELCTEQRLWENKQNILKTYKEAGYYLAEVETLADLNPDTNTITVTYEITEGQRIKVQEINFIGNDNLSSKSLSKQIKTRTGKHFDENFFEEDLITLVRYYQDAGFNQARIARHEKRFSDDKTELMLDLTVDEGPQFIIGTYTVQLTHSEKPAFSEEDIRDMLNPAEGEIFNRGEFEQALLEIEEAYQTKGYLLSQVDASPDFDEINGIVDLALNITEGDVIIIGDVHINGLEKTKDNVIRRELDQLDIKPGEFYDVQSLRKARQRIFRMGSFIRNVEFVPATSEGAIRDLIVTITETPRTGLLSLGGGYGTEGGIFGVAQIGENNLWGRAYRVHLKGELGARDRHTGELRFSTPWILGTPTRFSTSLYNTQRTHRYYGSIFRDRGYDRYTYKRVGGSLTFGRPLTKDIDLSIRLKNESVDAHGDRVETIEDRLTRSITFNLSRDTRDYQRSLHEPVSGSLNTLSYEYAGGFFGADNKFQRYSADSSWFLTSFFNHVLAGHVRASYLNSQSTDWRFLYYERYRLGGIDTVRGYEDYEIFPIVAGTNEYNYNGGNKVLYANLEYRIPFASQLTGVVFFDVGQVWDESITNVFSDFKLKKGAGVGIRFDLMGMLARLEWGYGFDRRPEIDGSRGKFHFTIGPGF